VTFKTRLQAPLAAVVAAAAALAATLPTKAAIAGGTTTRAALAYLAAASLTAAEVIVVDRIAAVRASDSMPVVERYIRAAGVISREDLGDDREEVEQPALRQGGSDRPAPLPFAQLVVIDMGVRYIGVHRCTMRLQGDDRVAGRAAAQALKRQRDLESAELHTLQIYGLGNDR
jgi:hypothetical protein